MPTPTQPQAMTAAELECHIADLAGHMEACYARFEAHGDSADRDSAVHFMHLRDQAIKARSPEQVARMEQALEERVSHGVDYFQTAGARDAVALRTTEHA